MAFISNGEKGNKDGVKQGVWIEVEVGMAFEIGSGDGWG